MSANKEAEVQMDLSFVGSVFVPHVREKALMCVVSTLISDKLYTGHSRAKYNLDPVCGFISSVFSLLIFSHATWVNTCWTPWAARLPLSSVVEAENRARCLCVSV